MKDNNNNNNNLPPVLTTGNNNHIINTNNVNTNSNINTSNSNKHLSPFTWSNIKLPLLQQIKQKQKVINVNIQDHKSISKQVKNQQNKQKQKQKQKPANNKQINLLKQLKEIPQKSHKKRYINNAEDIDKNNNQDNTNNNNKNPKYNYHQKQILSLQSKIKNKVIQKNQRNSLHIQFQQKLNKTIDLSSNKNTIYFPNKANQNLYNNVEDNANHYHRHELRYKKLNSMNNNTIDNSNTQQDKLNQFVSQKVSRLSKQLKQKINKTVTVKNDDKKQQNASIKQNSELIDKSQNYRLLKATPNRSIQKQQLDKNENIILNKTTNVHNTNHFRKLKAVIDTTDPHVSLKEKILTISANNNKNIPVQSNTFFGNPPKYILDGLLKAGWVHLSQKSKYISPQLIWTSNDITSNYDALQKKQIFNHVQGLYQLTLKSELHQSQQTSNFSSINPMKKLDYYPLSFLITQDRQKQIESFIENYQIHLLKSYLRRIAIALQNKYRKQILQNQDIVNLQETLQLSNVQRQIVKNQIPDVNLGYLLPKIMPTDCQQTLSMISLCIFFEKYCNSKLSHSKQYFSKMSNYVPIKVQKLNESVINRLLQKSITQMQDQVNFLYYQRQSNIINQQLEFLIIHYDKVLSIYDETYNSYGKNNIWIVKPSGGSKGKGIQFFNHKHYKESIQMINQRSTIKNQKNMINGNASVQSVKAFPLKQKYMNKVIQKYIQSPYLIELPSKKIMKTVKTIITKKKIKQKKSIEQNKQEIKKVNQDKNQQQTKVNHIQQQKQQKNQQQYQNQQNKIQQLKQNQQNTVKQKQLTEIQYQQYQQQIQIQVVDEQKQSKRPLKPYYNKKFDIRQWVLITSSNGILKIYRFSDAYLRFCSQGYTLDKMDLKIHLSNYTHNKNQNNVELTYILSHFFKQKEELIQSFYLQLDALIVNSVLNLQAFSNGRANSHFDKNCFQLLGYDVMLDQQGKLWLLEVNLNPGCDSERNQYLKIMAEKMVKEMIQIVSQQNTQQNIRLSDQDTSIQYQAQNICSQQIYKNDQKNQLKWVQLYSSKTMEQNMMKQSYPFNQKVLKMKEIDQRISVMKMIEKKTDACKLFDEISWPILMKICFFVLKNHAFSEQQSNDNDYQQLQNVQKNQKEQEIKPNQDQNIVRVQNSKANVEASLQNKINRKKVKNEQNPGCCGQ